LKPGDKVRVIDCLEADKYKGVTFTVVSDPWTVGNSELVKIESPDKKFNGGFSTACLMEVQENM
jgi:hypothetical protein